MPLDMVADFLMNLMYVKNIHPSHLLFLNVTFKEGVADAVKNKVYAAIHEFIHNRIYQDLDGAQTINWQGMGVNIWHSYYTTNKKVDVNLLKRLTTALIYSAYMPICNKLDITTDTFRIHATVEKE